MATTGIDLGSCTTKIVHVVEGKVVHAELFETGPDPLARVRDRLSRSALDDTRLAPSRVVATGYGRHLLGAEIGAQRVTEIKASAKGVHHLFPTCRTILDVGGQDCKVIHLNDKGIVTDFEMNDRCAAGTGKFLEVMAQTFGTNIEEFARIAANATSHVNISSMCTVFAESEVVSLITSGTPRDQIARGLHVAIAQRLLAMLHRIPLKDEVVFIGGGAKNNCLHALLETQTKRTIQRPSEPQLVVALGAALLGEETGNSID